MAREKIVYGLNKMKWYYRVTGGPGPSVLMAEWCLYMNSYTLLYGTDGFCSFKPVSKR